jgi:WD40 repeat protein
MAEGEAPVTVVAFIEGVAAATTGDGQVLFETGERVALHDGAILCACPHPDGLRLVTGGDDGKLRTVGPDGTIALLADFKSKWVNCVVSSADSGAVVAAVGKEAVVFLKDAEVARHSHPSTVGGLSFDAKGRRLAVSHYGGATLRYALVKDDAGIGLKWAGSHLAVALSPDASFAVTAMQENGLHGWRISDKKDLRMAGYEAKTKSLSFDKRGRQLATSGADCAVIWPFVGKDGPMGKGPALVGQRQVMCTFVAFHPSADKIAIGYADGAVVIANPEAPPARIWSKPNGVPITGLAWSAEGNRLASGDAAGTLTVAPG